MNERGECVVAKAVSVGEDDGDNGQGSTPKKGTPDTVSGDAPVQSRKWKYSRHCKPLTELR